MSFSACAAAQQGVWVRTQGTVLSQRDLGMSALLSVTSSFDVLGLEQGEYKNPENIFLIGSNRIVF